MTTQSASIASLNSTLDSLEEIGFGTDEPISAGDAGDIANALYADLLVCVENSRLATTSNAAETRAGAALKMVLSAFQHVGIGADGDDTEVYGADLIDEINDVLGDVYKAAGREPREGDADLDEDTPATQVGA